MRFVHCLAVAMLVLGIVAGYRAFGGATGTDADQPPAPAGACRP